MGQSRPMKLSDHLGTVAVLALYGNRLDIALDFVAAQRHLEAGRAAYQSTVAELASACSLVRDCFRVQYACIGALPAN